MSMKITKMTAETGEVSFEVQQNKDTPHSWDSYLFTMTKEEIKQLKDALNARDDI